VIISQPFWLAVHLIASLASVLEKVLSQRDDDTETGVLGHRLKLQRLHMSGQVTHLNMPNEKMSNGRDQRKEIYYTAWVLCGKRP
jgi:hypothetical protein